MTIGATAQLLEDIAKSTNKQTDTRVIREGMPAYLLLMDGMVEGWPDNERLLIAAAQGYATFASAFVEDQDRAYATVLYARAKEYALRSLEQRGFKNPVSRSLDDFDAGLNALGKNDVPYMFWTAMCWGNWIRLNMGSMEALAELPRVEAMMKRVLTLDAGYYYGGPHIFLGIWYSSRPKIAGGDLDAARKHFEKAIELGRGKFLMAYVYYADNYARKAFDKKLFIALLEKALDTPADTIPELTLLNTVAQTKAREMLDNLNELF
jgi:tetratricopeptide (TPR) repeat protein